MRIHAFKVNQAEFRRVKVNNYKCDNQIQSFLSKAGWVYAGCVELKELLFAVLRLVIDVCSNFIRSLKIIKLYSMLINSTKSLITTSRIQHA